MTSKIKIEIGPELWQDLKAIAGLNPATEFAAIIRDECGDADVVQIKRPFNLGDHDAALIAELCGKPIEWVDSKSSADKKEDA